jgi:hypothetical protein
VAAGYGEGPQGPAQPEGQFCDFALLGEFSEQLGPVPLVVIPSNPAHRQGFSISDFVIRIMAVDYQGQVQEK